MSLFIHYSIITQNDHFKYSWGKYHSLLEIAKIIKVSYSILCDLFNGTLGAVWREVWSPHQIVFLYLTELM
jgi:hypothetical protein